jgi:hypothetical protein
MPERKGRGQDRSYCFRLPAYAARENNPHTFGRPTLRRWSTKATGFQCISTVLVTGRGNQPEAEPGKMGQKIGVSGSANYS